VSIQFLGQFFIQQGGVTVEELREALGVMEQHNPGLAKLAVREGLLSNQQVEELSLDQRTIDQPFGELAVRRGLVSRDQLQALLKQQAAADIRLGDALVRLGHLTPEQLAQLEEEYERDVDSVRSSVSEVPGLTSHMLTETVLGLFYRHLVHTIRIPVELVAHESLPPTPRCAHAASLLFRGPQAMLAVLEADTALAVVCANALASQPVAETDGTLLAEALGELLNLTLGSVVPLLEGLGDQYWIDPPRYEAVTRRGASFQLVTDRGVGWLHLDPDPQLPHEAAEAEEDAL
jgi:hypothetical protein